MTTEQSTLQQILLAKGLLNVTSDEIRRFIDVFDHEQSELNKEWTYMSKKLLFVLASQNQEAYDQYLFHTVNYPSDSFNAEEVVKYYNKKLSNFNIILLVRKFVRSKNKSRELLWNHKEVLKTLKSDLKTTKDILSKSNLLTAKEIIGYINETRKHIDSLLKYNFVGFAVDLPLQNLFINGNTITKDEFLSIITVDKSAYTKEYIDTLPDIIDYKTLEDAIFVHKIEDENDEWMFDIFFDQFWAFRNAHKEEFKAMEDKLFDDLGFNQLPTYSVSFDEFGDVADIKQNPPNLKLIQ